MKALLVQGTWAWGHSTARQWWECSSGFCEFLKAQRFEILGGARPFIWNTELDGVGWMWRRPVKKHLNWESAGDNLYAYLVPALRANFEDYVPIADRNLIGHSHAMQVIAYACAGGLKINRLVTLGSPVRADMDAIYKRARPNIGSWLHVHSDGSDRIQWFGELFDGHLGIVRRQPYADINRLVAQVSHSRLLNDPTAFPLWQSEGLLDFLTKETA